MSRESVYTYPRRPKAEAFSNEVDVVKRLRDPTDPSTERTAPPRSAHVQLGDVPVGERSNFKKFPTHTQDHVDGIATRGESVCPRTLVDR